MQRGKAKAFPKNRERQRERIRQGGTDGTQKERSRGREGSREGAEVTLRGAVREAECRVYLEART